MSGKPCICHPLHKNCDPALCLEAQKGKWRERWGMKASKVISNIKTRLDIPSSSQKIVQPTTIKCRWTSLVDAADSQCPTCQALRTGFDLFDLFESCTPAEDRQRLTGLGLNVIIKPENSHVRMQTIRRFFGDSKPIYEYRQSPQSNALQACEVFPTGSFEPRGTGTSSSFEFCKHWLQDCLQNHRTTCKVGSKRLPHRVVRIGESTSEEFSLHLYESDATAGEYAALSHCWGPSSRVMKTTTQTLANWKYAIPWNNLSKTFQDAIIITQQLGIKYIWIDSLCIIQDDASDWEMESALMGDIYGNATITIAAVTSKDGDGGCLTEVKEPLVYDHPNLSKETPMTIRKRLTHEAYQYLRVDQERDRPLFSRAWTLQEELLAPRVLYFDAEEVIFQCQATIVCQCAAIREDVDGDRRKSTKHEFAEVHGRYLAYEPTLSTFRVNKSWASIVIQYSGRYLTRESDRFPALSGLAKSYENRGLGTYIAGLWTKDLPLWLTWNLRKYVGKANRRWQISYIAPSWSWASRPSGDAIAYPIFTSYSPDEDLSFLNYPHIVATNCELAGFDLTGAIKFASLSLRGRLMPAILKAWICDDRGNKHQVCTVQRAGWEASADIDIPQQGGEFSVLDGQGVFCLLLCTVKRQSFGSMYLPDKAFYLILDHGDQGGNTNVLASGIRRKSISSKTANALNFTGQAW